jgi:hypothetical protein
METLWRLVVVGGHTRSIGKTQLVCDIIAAFPKTKWIAGKITQYGHGVCAQNGENCDCAPEEHICALDWETRADTGTDSARFLAAGAKRAFWLRTKQGYLAEGLPLLRKALEEVAVGEGPMARKEMEERGVKEATERESNGRAGVESSGGKNTAVIVESNSLLQFVRPSLYFAVIDPLREDFKESAQVALDRAHALVLRDSLGLRGRAEEPPGPLWMRLPTKLLQEKPSVIQREGEPLPGPIEVLVGRVLEKEAGAKV